MRDCPTAAGAAAPAAAATKNPTADPRPPRMGHQVQAVLVDADRAGRVGAGKASITSSVNPARAATATPASRRSTATSARASRHRLSLTCDCLTDCLLDGFVVHIFTLCKMSTSLLFLLKLS